MSLVFLTKQIAQSFSVKEIKRQLSFKEQIFINCNQPFRPALTAALYLELKRPLVVICPSPTAAKTFFEQIKNYINTSELLFLPDCECYLFEPLQPDSLTVAQRMQTFAALSQRKRFLLVLSVNSLRQRVPKPQEKVYEPIKLEVGQKIDSNALLLSLVKKGFKRQPLVEKPGDFSVRGGVIDIFLPGSEPVRIDFFGSEIETIKQFDIDDQTSKEKLEKVKIYPVVEIDINEPSESDVSFSTHQPPPLRLNQKVKELSLINEYFQTEPIYVLDELSLVKEAVKKFDKTAQELLLEMEASENRKLNLDNFYAPLPEVMSGRQLILATLATEPPDVTVTAKRIEPLNGRIDQLEKQFWYWQKQNYRIFALLPEKGELERLKELATDLSVPVATESFNSKSLNLCQASIPEGFAFLEAKIVCFGYQDIWPRSVIKSEVQYKRKNLSLDFDDLKIGDLLVHEYHGIARFGGVLDEEVAGIRREYLLLEYAAGDKLYLPTDQLHKVTRYLGSESSKPPISRLNSTEWLQTKRRVQKSLKKLAVDLLKLYAIRAQTVGHAFSADTHWQKELEAGFPYTETKDQLEAVRMVKQDMEKPQPMDRLICGDVGYGKTEVALRAAFKAVMDGKQVLFLAPTTVLVQQHYLNFKERLAPFPVEIAQLSRFVPAKEQKELVEKIKIGLIDLVIGTHRLLQRDVKFKNLGLVIIDEEHRFGVNHKEKLRDLKKNVDVLSMSATPIPRTLQMSLSGVRDLSIIETPPEGRQAVLTYIGEYQPSLIAAAIRRELSRQGQVFYVSNRVRGIEHTAQKVKQMAPEAKVGIAHGQMGAKELEKVMLDFLARKINVLVCTTIVESGLDITNANTLIVEDADKFGLAQLYQLRGRIGRSHQRGFAYFTYRPGKDLTDTALARLKTMGEYTELGSGFKIALKDLEIRGAGNLLGAEQHGHMASVGFDLYCQMLKKEIDNLQHRLPEELPEVQIDLPVEAYIPKDYIENDNLRLLAYRQIALAGTPAELNKIAEELSDKYGRLPVELNRLFALARLKLKAARAGVERVRQLNNRLYIKFSQPTILNHLPVQLDFFIKGNTGELVVKLTKKPKNVILFLEEILTPPASIKEQMRGYN